MGFQEVGEPVDEDFRTWFAGDWKKMLHAVEVPGMPFASWDRKAAWIAWTFQQQREVTRGSLAVTIPSVVSAAVAPPARTRTPVKVPVASPRTAPSRSAAVSRTRDRPR